MKTATEILQRAKISPREYEGIRNIKEDEYNTSYLLSHEQIQAAALLKISEGLDISVTEAAKQYYIDGVSVEGTEAFLTPELMRTFYSQTIENAVEAAKKGKPAFLALDNGKHFVLAAIVPDPKDPNELSVVYINSMPQSLPEYADHHFAVTGKKFAKTLVEYIDANKKALGVTIASEVIDQSKSQQLANCCGLSVASNIASVAVHCAQGKSATTIVDSLFDPEKGVDALALEVVVANKDAYYKSFGKGLFTTLDDVTLNLSQAYSSKPKPKEESRVDRPVDPYDLALESLKMNDIETAVDIIRSLNIPNSELHPNNIKLIKVLEEIEKKSGGVDKAPPLIQGYLETIRSFNKKIEVDLRDPIREVSSALKEDKSLIDSVLDQVPISTKVKLTVKEKEQLDVAVEKAKGKENLPEAFEELRERSPKGIGAILGAITSFIVSCIEKAKSWVSSITQRGNSQDNQRSP